MGDRNLFLIFLGGLFVFILVLCLLAVISLGRKHKKEAFVSDFSCVQIENHRIQGDSLEPLISSGSQVKLLRNYYQCNPFQRGDLVVLKFKSKKELFIKKLMGLPGDRVEFENDYLKLNGKILKNSASQPYKFSEQSKKILKIPLKNGRIPPDKYLVLSDQTSKLSFDSRKFGYLEKDHFIGKVLTLAEFEKLKKK